MSNVTELFPVSSSTTDLVYWGSSVQKPPLPPVNPDSFNQNKLQNIAQIRKKLLAERSRELLFRECWGLFNIFFVKKAMKSVIQILFTVLFSCYVIGKCWVSQWRFATIPGRLEGEGGEFINGILYLCFLGDPQEELVEGQVVTDGVLKINGRKKCSSSNKFKASNDIEAYTSSLALVL